MIALALPYLVLRQLQWSPFKLGLLYTAASISTAVLGFGLGILTDVWGRKRTLLLAGALLPLSSGIICVSHSFWPLLVASVLGGYSATGSLAGGGVGGAAQPIQNALLADYARTERRTSVYAGFSFLSGVTAAFGTLLTRFMSVDRVFEVATFVSALGLLLVLPLRTSRVRGSFKRVKGAGVIGKFSLTGILNGASQGLVTPFLIPFFVVVYHLSKDRMAPVAFWAGLLGAVSLLCAPWVEKRLGFVSTIAVTRGLGALLLLLMPWIHWLPFSIFVYLLTPALRVIAVPVQQSALTARVNPEEFGRALGANQVARLAASSVGTALSGALFGMSDIATPFVLYATLMATNIGLYFRFFGREKASEGQ